MSLVAVPGRLSNVPSPQFTVMLLTGVELVAVKVRLTLVPVAAGFGVGLLTLTVGGVTSV